MTKKYHSRSTGLGMIATALFLIPSYVYAIVVDIGFPLDVPSQFRDDFGEPRAGHAHKGIDIIAPKMSPILSTVDGYVRRLEIPEARWGYEIGIQGDDGYFYNYIHINNDTPGTDDGAGGPENAYAPGLTEGSRVARGQLIGWVGDSGNAESVGSHLHFEMRDSGRGLVNPYESLVAALARATSTFASTTIILPTPEKVTYTFTKRLALGSTGAEVKNLQKVLRALGYFDHPTITGYYGALTQKAVKEFQRSKGLEAVGFVGPRTRAELSLIGV
jgi:hypothetical protein